MADNKSDEPQKFISQQHAFQRRKLRTPSGSIKKISSTSSDRSSPKHLSSIHGDKFSKDKISMKTQQLNFNEAAQVIGRFNEYGAILRRDHTLQELANHLMYLAELAEQTLMSESSDWFDSHTIKRNVKEIKTYVSEFNKFANEADILNQRMSVLYDDLGRIFERYFDISDVNSDKIGSNTKDALNNGEEDKPKVLADPIVTEDDGTPLNRFQQMQRIAGSSEIGNVDGLEIDQLTARAFVKVFQLFKDEKNQTILLTAPIDKIVKLIWRVIQQHGQRTVKPTQKQHRQ